MPALTVKLISVNGPKPDPKLTGPRPAIWDSALSVHISFTAIASGWPRKPDPGTGSTIDQLKVITSMRPHLDRQSGVAKIGIAGFGSVWY